MSSFRVPSLQNILGGSSEKCCLSHLASVVPEKPTWFIKQPGNNTSSCTLVHFTEWGIIEICQYWLSVGFALLNIFQWKCFEIFLKTNEMFSVKFSWTQQMKRTFMENSCTSRKLHYKIITADWVFMPFWLDFIELSCIYTSLFTGTWNLHECSFHWLCPWKFNILLVLKKSKSKP